MDTTPPLRLNYGPFNKVAHIGAEGEFARLDKALDEVQENKTSLWPFTHAIKNNTMRKVLEDTMLLQSGNSAYNDVDIYIHDVEQVQAYFQGDPDFSKVTFFHTNDQNIYEWVCKHKEKDGEASRMFVITTENAASHPKAWGSAAQEAAKRKSPQVIYKDHRQPGDPASDDEVQFISDSEHRDEVQFISEHRAVESKREDPTSDDDDVQFVSEQRMEGF